MESMMVIHLDKVLGSMLEIEKDRMLEQLWVNSLVRMMVLESVSQ